MTLIARLLTLAFIAALPSTLLAQRPDPRVVGFDAYVAKAVKDWNAVGLAVAVVKDGRTVYAKGFGVRELGKPEPVDANTMFAIGSTTKAMTALALGMLVDEGKVAWDDPVIKHLPGFELSDPYITREITVRDLLTHRAGLGNGDVTWYRTDATLQDILHRARFIPIAYSMRSGYIYQNVAYGAAGAVVAAASGMSWERFVETRIFQPLGMTNTVATLAGTKGRPNVASPHDRVNGTVRVIDNAAVDAVAAAGSVWGSIDDMTKWMTFVLDSAKVDGKRLLKPATWAELFAPQTIIRPNSFYPTAALTKPNWITYGLGWFQTDYQGRPLQLHTGSIDGMIAIVGLVRGANMGVFVLGNLDHVEVRHPLLYRAVDTWVGNPLRDWSTEMLTLYNGISAQGDSARARFERQRLQGTKPSLVLDAYTGVYRDSLAGQLDITLENGALVLRQGTQLRSVLSHWHLDTFRAKPDLEWRGEQTVNFAIGASGRVDAVQLGGRRFGRAR